MQMLMNGAIITADLKDSMTRAVIISLFSWRRADSSDDIDSDQSKQGWWGDTYSVDRIGSKLWQLLRQKITDEVLTRAEDYSRTALQWLIDDGHVDEIKVNAHRNDNDFNRIDIVVELISNTKTVYEFKEL